MFTGIVTDLGRVESFSGGRLIIHSNYDNSGIELGSSIACDGTCLTVVEKHPGGVLYFDVSPETLSRTTLGSWQPGRRVNLERALAVGQELGGHFVTGHVDAVGRIAARNEQGDWLNLIVSHPESLANFFVPKGSITVNGVSLTVNDVTPQGLALTIIPHTASVTNLGALCEGDAVNLEVDVIARYIAPYLQNRNL